MAREAKRLCFGSRGEWRAWLEKNKKLGMK